MGNRYCIVTNGIVTNVILWDGVADIGLASTDQAVQSDTGNIGDTYVNGAFTPPQSTQTPSAPAPFTVDMWKAKAVLKSTPFTPTAAQVAAMPPLNGTTNLLDATTALIGASGNAALEAFWEYATTMQSDNQNLANLAATLGLTPDQVAAMFKAAQAITV